MTPGVPTAIAVFGPAAATTPVASWPGVTLAPSLNWPNSDALCASEFGQFNDGASVTPGHEATGVVAAAGPNTAIAVGTPGVIFLMDYCGECRSCRQGFTNQ